ncbi:alpha-glucosidase/alpha-galactosidase [Niallia taxi]|uniref:family 4 glycosyl hydrolase n=1 Tax=Niallia taxi TaxID=2499688 RepID=UPI0021A58500|nr:alpha-glucosidase/alpha-galactosidase [Niallia taxi]MCT2343389.1 alpha-glucosidase/alpha-galactosidase [Niallia taxi]MDE5053094.1 alpha-glucosidase/alpha-galactosidase [Niallia taxi]
MATDTIKIAYIGGGSQGWARRLMYDLALEPRLSGTIALYDINHDAAKTNQRIGTLISNHPDATGKWTYEAIPTIEEALKDAEFVIISILPGTFADMAKDVHFPEKYGIYQSVGDTVGPGGIRRAVRSIPLFMEIGEQIKLHCPDAWVINYTNPMSVCTRTLYKAFPQIKAIGCCHEVFETQHLLANMAEEMLGVTVENRKDIKVSVTGINHFTWINEATYQNIDLFPLYAKFAEKYAHTGFEKEQGKWEESVFHSSNRVKFDLFQKYRLIAAAGDRHLAEFMPPVYLKNPQTVHDWKFHLTTVDFRVKDQQRKISENEEVFTDDTKIVLEPSGEEGVEILLALLGIEDLVTNVNFPNKGQIQNLPKDAIVETNALIRKNSVQPVRTNDIPLDVANMVNRHILNQEAVIQAVLTEDKNLARNAFVNDPLIAAISYDNAVSLFEEMDVWQQN